MSWVRVDDMFWQHPKFLSISEDALALWIRALAYTNGSRTDGFVPSNALCLLSRSKRPARAAGELVSAGLWKVEPNGWVFHDWAVYQASRETREKATADKSRRQQEWRERLRRGASTETVGRQHVDASTPQHGDAAPIPSHPIPSQSIQERAREEPAAEPEPRPPEPAKAGPHVRGVFEAYLAGWRQHVNRGAVPVLTPKREKVIKARLREHPLEVVAKAAGGIWSSSWHRENGQTSIDLALRDAAHVERFAGEPVRPANGMRTRQQLGLQGADAGGEY